MSRTLPPPNPSVPGVSSPHFELLGRHRSFHRTTNMKTDIHDEKLLVFLSFFPAQGQGQGEGRDLFVCFLGTFHISREDIRERLTPVCHVSTSQGKSKVWVWGRSWHLEFFDVVLGFYLNLFISCHSGRHFKTNICVASGFLGFYKYVFSDLRVCICVCNIVEPIFFLLQ